MSLDPSHGGETSHGFMTTTKRASITSIYFETMHYHLDDNTGLINFQALAKMAAVFRPKLIMAGSAVYPRRIEYDKFREVADSVGAYLVADISNIAGLIATDCHMSPFKHCDVVTVASQVCTSRRWNELFFVVSLRLIASMREMNHRPSGDAPLSLGLSIRRGGGRSYAEC